MPGSSDFYLNLDRWEAISTIERTRGRWEARLEGSAARVDPIFREVVFQAAFGVTHPPSASPDERTRKLVLSPAQPPDLAGPPLQAWRYARAMQFAHGWKDAFGWNQTSIVQLQRIIGVPDRPTDAPPDPEAARLIHLRLQAAVAGRNAGEVPLIEIGTFIGGMRQILRDVSADRCLYLLALRLLVIQSGYVQAQFAPIEKILLGMLGDGSRVVPGPDAPGDEPLGLWLDEAIALLLEVGRSAEQAWERRQVAIPRSALQEAILAYAQRNGKLTAGQVMLSTGANRNTIKDNLARLVEEGVLIKKGIKRGTVYIPC